ncbi:MAG: hypothetical protein HQ490_06015 [Lutibacter sp.]|nr:hypothetical protein [Lutibacter sp.]
MNRNIAILVASHDGYQDIWHPFFHYFYHSWPDCPYPLFLGTNKVEYFDKRVTSLLIGEDKDYSSNLISMISQIEQEWVILSVEDIFLNKTVDNQRFTNLIEFAINHEIDHLHLIYKKVNPFNLIFHKHKITNEIYELPRGIPYRISITFCLWKKNVLLDLLKKGESAWELELNGSRRSDNLKFRSCTISEKHSPPLLKWKHGVIKGIWTYEGLKFIKKSNQDFDLSKRRSQNLLSHIYLKLYTLARYIYLGYCKRNISKNALKNIKIP